MLDIRARDLGARLAQWTLGARELRLPAVAHVHTPERPAPAFATLVLAREEHPTLPTIVAPGSVFTPTSASTGDGVLPKALVYPNAAGHELQGAADRLIPASPLRVVNTTEAITGDEQLVVLTSARPIARDPWRLPKLLLDARTRAGPNAVLFCPGIGAPEEMCLAAYAGVDVFDGLVPVLAALQGRYLTTEGPLAPPLEPGCACAACDTANGVWTAPLLAHHNQWACEAESRRVRQAIGEGALRELVEARVRAAPELVAMLRRYDVDHQAFFLPRAPALRERDLPVVSRESLMRPEIVRWVQRLETRYTPPTPAKVLVVLPCSATKPYENSPTHRAIRPAIQWAGRGRAHVVTLTSPLGAVPEELELAYPAAHYDIPVTGTWFEEERTVCQRAFAALAATGAYERVILHVVPTEADLIAEVFPKAERNVLADESPTSTQAIARLRAAVDEATRGHEAAPRRLLFEEHMRSRFDWQFGRGVGAKMMLGAIVRGKYPLLKVFAGRTQLAMLQYARGALTLTTDGGKRLVEATSEHTVEIDDFRPKGTIFAVGVRDASPTILLEDEVVVCHEGEVRAVGRALAPGIEMGRLARGPAVEVRHHA